MRSVYEAVVLGAGPAGCSAAIHLKRLGIDVLSLVLGAYGVARIIGSTPALFYQFMETRFPTLLLCPPFLKFLTAK